MSSVILDPQTLERLRQTGGRVEILDPSGQRVGYFTPTVWRFNPRRKSS